VSDATLQIGNSKQHGYVHALARRVSMPDLRQVCAQVLGAIPEDGQITVPEASRVIAFLEAMPGQEAKPGNRPQVRTLSAKLIRAITTGAEAKPADADPDSLWVLEMVERALLITQVVRNEPGKGGCNNHGPIRMSALIEHFGDIERLARAFGVTVSTVKSWGDTLPQAREYEAEVKTHRRFQATRP
jgi:hypothetical protein